MTATALIAGVGHAQQSAPTFDQLAKEAKTALVANPATALAKARQAEHVGSAIVDLADRDASRAAALRLQSEAYLGLGQLSQASIAIGQAQVLASKLPAGTKLQGEIRDSAGGIHAARVELPAALNDYHAATAIYQRLGDTRAEAIVLLNIGALYDQANDWISALKYVDEAAALRNTDPLLLLTINNNRAGRLVELSRYHDAEISYRKSSNLAKRTGNKLLDARILANIAALRLKLHDEAGASDLLRQSSALMQGPEAASFRPRLFEIEAQIAYQRHDYRTAAGLIAKRFAGVDLATTTTEARDAHRTAYDIYRALGDAPHAVAHLAALKRIDDQATRLATSANIALAGARFDFANQELRLTKLQRDDATRTAAFERQRAHTQRMIFLGSAAATAALIAILAVWLVTLRRSNEKVRATAADLANSNVALGKALAAKTEFLATTSHEIRTPLNGILGMTQVMLADARLADDLRDRINVVHGAGITMRALVDDILDVAKMETGNLTVERAPVDLRATLREAARMWEEQAQDKGIAFALDLDDCPASIESDATRLRQIVFNLLSNALKFTAAGRVSLTARRVDGRLHLIVRDTGIGIAVDKRDMIFESFRQADTSTTRQFGGTGLGLAICRNLARAMGGEISVDGDVGQGSTFTVSLPLVELAAPGGAAGEGGAAAAAATLVVDANPITRAMLKTMIAARDPSATACAAIAEALATARPGDRLLVDQSALADAAALESLAALGERGCRAWVLWKGEPPAAVARCAVILAKPIVGPAIVEELFTSEWHGPTGSALVRDAA